MDTKLEEHILEARVILTGDRVWVKLKGPHDVIKAIDNMAYHEGGFYGPIMRVTGGAEHDDYAELTLFAKDDSE